MRKTLEELKGLSMEEVEKYFKDIINEEYGIDSVQFEDAQAFISEVGKRDGLETLLDVMQIIKQKGLTENQLILALAAKMSEVNQILNKLLEAENIIKMIQFKDRLQEMSEKMIEEGGPFPNLQKVTEEESEEEK